MPSSLLPPPPPLRRAHLCSIPPRPSAPLTRLIPATTLPTTPLAFQQVNLHDEKWWNEKAESGSSPTRTARIPASSGSVVLFDIRALHRGTRNAGSTTRSVLYMGYVQRWYRDTVNFREAHHTEAWRRLKDTDMRDLTARLDRDAALAVAGGAGGGR